jgi:hypothetical protein
MSTRKRKPTEKKLPAFRSVTVNEEQGETDLKKVKAAVIKELEENKAKEKEWYDTEMDKNLKNIK